jgi:hypothetical protein
MELHEKAHPRIFLEKETTGEVRREARREPSETTAGPRKELPGN